MLGGKKMYLSRNTDYSLKILTYMAKKEDKFSTVEELQKELDIPNHSAKKSVYNLAKYNILKSTKGRTGGIKLEKDPKNINLGEVIKVTEANFSLEEYFTKNNGSTYKISSDKFKYIISDAFNEFINEFSKYTLEDIL